MMLKNADNTGTLPIFGSIMLAIDKPIEPDIACPATTKVADAT